MMFKLGGRKTQSHRVRIVLPMADHSKLVDVTSMTRNQVVPYYRCLILSEVDRHEVIRVNQLILSKWTSAGLQYIKNKAWKGIDLL
jgi:hypothetical protein